MSTVIEQPRNDVPIVADATLLAVPAPQDDAGRAEYLQKIRALRNSEKAAPAEPEAVKKAPVSQPEVIDPPEEEDLQQDAIQSDEPRDAEVSDSPGDTPSNRTRLSKDDLKDYEIPVTNENGEIEYLSYDEFEKTVGTYSKQNKRARELAEREREVEAIKTKLVEEQTRIVNQTTGQEAKLQSRYQWVQQSLEHAAKYGIDVVEFEDGTKKKVTQLIAEKAAIESNYQKLQSRKEEAKRSIERAREDFIKEQDRILEERAPNVKKARADIAKFLERNGFTSEESNALAYSKAELLMLIDKAMRYENATKSQTKEKKVAQNTKVLKQPSRLSGRGTPANSPVMSRMQELQSKGTRATANELRELRRLQLANR